MITLDAETMANVSFKVTRCDGTSITDRMPPLRDLIVLPIQLTWISERPDGCLKMVRKQGSMNLPVVPSGPWLDRRQIQSFASSRVPKIIIQR